MTELIVLMKAEEKVEMKIVLKLDVKSVEKVGVEMVEEKASVMPTIFLYLFCSFNPHYHLQTDHYQTTL